MPLAVRNSCSAVGAGGVSDVGVEPFEVCVRDTVRPEPVGVTGGGIACWSARRNDTETSADGARGVLGTEAMHSRHATSA